MHPLIPHQRTGYHQDLLHRTSHYLGLLNSKPTVSSHLDNRSYLDLLGRNKKLQKQQHAKRRAENDKLLNALSKIERTSKRYSHNEPYDSAKLERKLTMKSDYK